jgi:integrase
MSARKRHNKWWVDFRFDRQRYRRPSPDNSKAGALAYEALVRQKLARGEDVFYSNKRPELEKKEDVKKPWNFSEFAWKWFEVYVRNNNKFSEIGNKKSVLNVHLIPYFGEKHLDKISNLDIEEYKTKKLKSGLSAKSINNTLIVLSRCLNIALEWNVLEKVPKIKKMNVAPQKYDFLTETESQQLLNNTDGILHEMILVALKTGVRLGELIALDWSDIDFREKILTVQQAIARGRLGSTKSNRIRKIPLTDEVCEILLKRVQKEGFVFAGKNNNHLRAEYSLKLLKKTCKRIGFRKIGWHTLRHTFASHLAGNNVPMKAIQELLGHSDIVTTMRYSHISHSTLRDAVRTLEGKNSGHNMVTMPSTGIQNGIVNINRDCRIKA